MPAAFTLIVDKRRYYAIDAARHERCYALIAVFADFAAFATA